MIAGMNYEELIKSLKSYINSFITTGKLRHANGNLKDFLSVVDQLNVHLEHFPHRYYRLYGRSIMNRLVTQSAHANREDAYEIYKFLLRLQSPNMPKIHDLILELKMHLNFYYQFNYVSSSEITRIYTQIIIHDSYDKDSMKHSSGSNILVRFSQHKPKNFMLHNKLKEIFAAQPKVKDENSNWQRFRMSYSTDSIFNERKPRTVTRKTFRKRGRNSESEIPRTKSEGDVGAGMSPPSPLKKIAFTSE